MRKTQMLDNGRWVDAVEEPYYPNLIERIKHMIFGYHIWTDWDKYANRANRRCVICKEVEYIDL